MKETNYVNIEGWMKERLGLRGNELFVYAIVYGFSQDGAGWYIGGREYVADWLGCTVKTAGTVLANLTEKGVLRRLEVGGERGRRYRYQAVGLGENFFRSREKNAPIRDEIFPPLGEKNAHITTKGDYKEEYKGERGRFAPPTRDEVAAYAREKGYDGFPVDRFIAYYESNGWMVGRSKMKSWKASMTNWWLRDHQGKPSQPKLQVSEEIMAEWERENEAMRKRLGMI